MALRRTGACSPDRAPAARRPVPLLLLAVALLFVARPALAGEAPFMLLNVNGTAYNVSYAPISYNDSTAQLEGCGAPAPRAGAQLLQWRAWPFRPCRAPPAVLPNCSSTGSPLPGDRCSHVHALRRARHMCAPGT